MIIVYIRCFIDSTYLSPNISVKPVGWAQFSSWKNGDCKKFTGSSGPPCSQVLRALVLGRRIARLPLPIPLPPCCATLRVSQLQIARWGNATRERTHWGRVEAGGLICCRTLMRIVWIPLGGKYSGCLHFCFWCVEMSAWYWKVNHTLKGKILSVSGQKSGEQMNETLRFVPVLRNALEWANNTLRDVSCPQGACFDCTDRILAVGQSEEKGDVIDKGNEVRNVRTH